MREAGVRDQGLGAARDRDLVVIALPGVQRFITEARSTADVSASSEVFVALAVRAIEVLTSENGELVLPSRDAAGSGMPNRVVALLPAGSGVAAARQVSGALEESWQGWVRDSLGLTASDRVPKTPGAPCANWVCVPPKSGGYEEQWRQAQLLLSARRRVRDFNAVEQRQRTLCSLAPRWPAEPVPRGLPPHEKATLSAAGWVKRRWRYMRREKGFPSTASIASAPFRRAVLSHLSEPSVLSALDDLAGAVAEMCAVVPGWAGEETLVPGLPLPSGGPGRWLAASGGPWVYEDRWQADSLAREALDAGAVPDPASISRVAERGRGAARLLTKLMSDAGLPGPAAYLAVMVQDIDSMGRFLGGEAVNAAGKRISVSPDAHREVSAGLMDLATAQQRRLRDVDLHGVTVYAGGDDLLAFTPAATALRAASACHAMLPQGLPHASTAVLFFHYHSSLQGAISQARELLEQGKARVMGKHALAVGYRRRSGAGAASIQPWSGPDGATAADLFGVFSAGAGHPLSPRLLADLDRDADELARLSAAPGDHYRAEMARLVRRHTRDGTTGGREQAARSAAALAWLGASERSPRPERESGRWEGEPGRPQREMARARPQPAARVAVFLRQEAT